MIVSFVYYIKKIILCFFLILTLFVLGCPTTSRIIPLSNLEQNMVVSGICFALPKTILEVTISYTLVERTTWQADIHGQPIKEKDGKPVEWKSKVREVIIDKPIKIITKTMADPKLRFVFDTESLNGFTKDTDITITLTKDGLIKGTNVDVKDKTTEIVENFTNTVFNIAKFAAVAGEDVIITEKIGTTTVIRCIDPTDLTFSKKNHMYIAEYSDIEQAKDLFTDLEPPEVKIKIIAESDLANNSKNIADHLQFDGKRITELSGIPYRFPEPAQVDISIDDKLAYHNYHNFVQGRKLYFIPISAEAFSNVKQTLTFLDDGSVLIEYEAASTSRGEMISETAKEASDILTQEYKELEKVLIEAEIELLKKQKEMMKLRKELIETELALEEAEKNKEEPDSD